MGMIWRLTMPLLSTLAALVIIVHSAEEDLDPEYRYDLRPRVLDTGTPSYEQPWRLVAREPEMRHTTQTDWSSASIEDPPKRRRKRKRRPLDSSTEDHVSQERYTYPDAPPPSYHEADDSTTYQTTEIPRRRRKRINARPDRWADESIESDRLIRRRGQRRKRPLLDNWAGLSEFSENRRGSPPEIDTEAKSLDTDPQVDEKEKQNHRDHERQLIEFNDDKWDLLRPKSDIVPQETNDRLVLDLDLSSIAQSDTTQVQEDKSLSEFSIEDGSQKKVEVKENYTEKKIKDKIPKSLDNGQMNQPIDPVTLKDILKRSNGSSLSEILQQHNLSLADLLHGKENVISILQSKDSLDPRSREILTDSVIDKSEALETSKLNEEQEIQAHESKTPSFSSNQPDKVVVIESPEHSNQNAKHGNESVIKSLPKERHGTGQNIKRRPNLTLRRRFPTGIRKLRMRPILNGTYKGQLSRDMMALNARRYQNRRNNTKSQEWKTLIPLMINMNTSKETQNNIYVTEPVITTTTSEEPTTIVDNDKPKITVTATEDTQTNTNNNFSDIEIVYTETEAIPTTTLESTLTETQLSVTEKPVVTPIIRQLNASSIRRQSFNNRLKKKRLKQKNSTTESPQDDMIKNLFGLGNLVSSSEFIAKTTKKELSTEGNVDFTGLEDFLTTAMSRKTEASTKSITSSTPTRSSTTPKYPATWVTTEETAKFEIEEILNDTRTSAKLSKILMERNMTLNELVEHRERGSSHVHLADIFHNASREPNPPEPFLSKSLIEPISKETYPLRALLEANLHDPMAKVTTIDPILSDSNYVNNIPIVMDFGNNVNENAENMGIMSLFNNFTHDSMNMHKTLQKDSEGTPYESTIIHVNATNENNINRESRVLDDQDMVSWNEIFTMIRNTQHNGTEEVEERYKKDIPPAETYKKIMIEEDVDGDGLIVFEDLQHLRDFDSHIAPASDEKLAVDSYETSQDMIKPGILTKKSSNTKSVTVATASIVGLALILFLLTYAAFKWIQQKKREKKRSFGDERIPTPVFEIRKGLKHNNSTRSISPMLSTSNIYTMNTLDSHHGKDSPEYMWDSLRKPFQ